ncbi:hypothetical protein GCM10017764_03730 [Sphingobacterium griseoflavum]|uniref:histidine kinase n=1 Tax=Sphingobacterium griseoflavum TaxID=1474952 RepID=A0ABQ3HT60_9SPHI|nr:hypothetical protein GCM10017764_03730 [Sphingobacterium griseoflavum]
MLELSFFWGDYDTVKALRYVDDAKKVLGVRAQEPFYRGLFAFYRAAVHFELNSALAKTLYMDAEGHLRPLGDNPQALRYRARLWGSYGALLQRDGDAAGYAAVLLEKVIPIAKAIQDSVLWGNNLQNMAMTMMNLQHYEKADSYYEEALLLLRGKANSGEQKLTLYVNAAKNSMFQQDMEAARKLLDSAERVVKQVPLSSYLPLYYTVEANFWERNGQLEKALHYLDRGLELANEMQSDDLVPTILYGKYEIYQRANRLEEAKRTLLAVLPYVERKALLRNKQTLYYNVAHLYGQMGKYKEATSWFEKFKLISDTVFAHAGEQKILALEQKFHAKERENELLLARSKNQAQELSLRKTQGWLLVAGLAVLVLSMVFFLWYSALRNRRRWILQKKLLLEQELKNVQQREKINVFNAMVQGQEKERSRIARDLHDGLGGMLASVKHKLSAVAEGQHRSNLNETDMELYNIIKQLDQSVDELRRVARNMMPESLLYMGLEAALRDLCAAMEHRGLRVEFQARGLRDDYGQAFLISVYRIVQELLTNAVKHSGAQKIWVQCFENDGHVYLSVEDDGKGFSFVEAKRSSIGIGLSNIQNRVELLNGKMEVDSAPDKGASFHIDFDLNE